MNIFTIVPAIPRKDETNIYISIGSISIIFILFCAQRFLTRHLQLLTLIILFIFNFSRLSVIAINHEKLTPVSLFLQGYIFGSVQCIVLVLLQNFRHKLFALSISFGVRYGVLIGSVEPSAFNVIALIRQIINDTFLLYIFYTNTRMERSVFRDFFGNRDELIKFKALLAESLPQSIAIYDYNTCQKIYGNVAFYEAFWDSSSTSIDTNKTENCFVTEGEGQTVLKINLNHLQVDPLTLREVGSSQNELEMTINSFKGIISFEELITKLTQDHILNEKTLSVNASSISKQKTFEVILKRIKWDGVDAIAIILNDTTYQENLISLKVANGNKDKLIATVSHELRTPLHGIIGLIEIVENRVNNFEVRDHLSLCKDNAYLLLSLVNSLLDLQQISTGKLKLNLAKISLSKLLNDVIQLFKYQCSQKGIEIVTKLNEGAPTHIFNDENRLKQILINLVNNAIKFTFQGSVTIEVSQDQEETSCIHFSVKDTGIGIKEQDMKQLFKMYGRLADGESVNKHGVGLGLTISSTLAALLNNKSHDRGIDVTSTYGRGSNFHFKILKDFNEANLSKNEHPNKREIEFNSLSKESTTAVTSIGGMVQKKTEANGENLDSGKNERDEGMLSFVDELVEPLSIQHNMKGHQTLRKKEVKNYSERKPERDVSNLAIVSSDKKSEEVPRDRGSVLVVDDNPFNILVAKNLIKDLGYSVKSATHGYETIDIVKSCAKSGEVIKVIFMDCQMPLMDGFETTRRLRKMMKNKEIPNIPIYAWTANNGEEEIRRCFESGMSGYLSKPTTKAAVLKAIPE